MPGAAQRLDERLRAELESLHAQSLYRQRRIVEGPQGAEITVNGQRLLNFSSNDYLGLAAHPALATAARRALDEYGTGSGAAHLVTGHTRAHHALEAELAEFVQRPQALLFSSGYLANLGIAGALAGRGDRVLEDRLNHASLLDAGLLCGARFSRYAHADAKALAARLQQTGKRKLAMTDGVFSMDGDLAPLPDMARVSAAAGAMLVVDDAHGFGVLGEHGRGTLEHFRLGLEEVPVLMATLGKALGSFGAFVAGSEALIETLIQKARTYIYTTAPPAAWAAATRAALKLLREESWRRGKLHVLIARLRAGAAQLDLPILESRTAIQPLMIGDAARALAVSKDLEARGILAVAIRPPTVPAGRARLRLTLTAAHSEAQVDQLLDALARVMKTVSD
ncbi:MAG: 8-amino-7-oxononanoate synthase [Gammaproteobacteria bacterium]|nr:8-amino-7-oxononanoate synthase [Gammaproteobacteria bacterium]MBU6508878.1 8-amino-7-oxononanoate synthase [Gammaproteobacteria bacterium]MDE1983740.1 8-amino-7-oxononanoate synthase [Gammaproteobacteria bacterium]MDE2108438.1 8-amino-7-oxononanoate synthase [Gammaproteobacteria bacterium]MDE2460561.1 8-amino-7-oxononanoate synthase [Gammaproteobacteria bacterium]